MLTPEVTAHAAQDGIERGTTATRSHVAGIPERVTAGSWVGEEECVARIVRRYVDRTSATRAIVYQPNEKGTRQHSAKIACNPVLWLFGRGALLCAARDMGDRSYRTHG